MRLIQRWMNLLTASILLELVVFSVSAPAAPVVIDFEDLQAGPIGTPARVSVNTQYADRGITFNNPVALDFSDSSILGYPPNFAHSGANAIETCYAIESCTVPIEMTFTTPQTRVKVWVGLDATGLNSFFSPLTVRLSVFDIGGREVGRATTAFTAPFGIIPIRTPLEVLSQSANIVRADLQLLLADGSVFITNPLAVDDVEFETGTPTQPITTTFGPPSTSNRSGTFAEPVNTATGNYLFQRTDLAIPGRGLSFIFTRTYNSLDTYAGPLGHGWTHSYNIFLIENADGTVVIKHGDGHEEFYDPTGSGNYQSRFAGVFNVLVKNADGTFVLTMKNQIHYEFSTNGRLTRIRDRNHNALSFSYDGKGNMITIIDTVDRKINLSYDTQGHLIRLTDPIGRTIEYRYDVDANLASDTDPSGGVTSYNYDVAHRMTEITDQRLNTLLENIYDTAGRVTSQTNGRGFHTTFVYGVPNTGDTRITDPRGRSAIHTHDLEGRLVDVTDALGHRAAITYDADNNRTSIQDKNGNITRFAYDAQNNLTSITDALGNSVAFAYDDRNNLTHARDARGFGATYTYDIRGNLSTIQDALGNITSFVFDRLGQLRTTKDARGHVTSYQYDEAGNLTSVARALGSDTTTIVVTYDELGQPISTTNAKGHTTRKRFDLNGRLLQIIDPLGHATHFAYDPVGNLIQVVNANDQRTQYRYDNVSNLTAVTDALGHVTHYTYDANNNLTSIMDANGHVRSFLYDALNRLTNSVNPLGEKKMFSHDAVGNVTAVTSADGTTNTRTYDAVNNLVRITYADGLFVNYAYDSSGNRVRMEDSLGITLYNFDALERLTQVILPDGGVVGYGYDAVGNRTALIHPDGKRVSYAYDEINRLSHVKDWAGRETRYRYDATGNLSDVRYPNNTSVIYRYDAADRLVLADYRRNEVSTSRLKYALDGLGNRIEMAIGGQIGEGGAAIVSYEYDALSQLTAVTQSASDDGIERTEYTYDRVGNRLRTREFALQAPGTYKRSPRAVDYTYDAADRLVRAGNSTFEYDANGNRIGAFELGGATTRYAYNAANRLVRVIADGKEVTYTYDGDGNKVEQTVNGNATKSVRFLTDVAPLLPVILEEDHVSHGKSDDVVRYLYGVDLISQELSRRVPQALFYNSDGLGSTIALTDFSGNTRAEYEYDPFGNLNKSRGDVANRFLFTGEERDPETGLYYLRSRWYDATVGRFITDNSFGALVPLPLSFNRSLYALNNPANVVDPLGACCGWDTLKGAAKTVSNGVKSGAEYVGGKVVDAATSTVGRAIISTTLDLGITYGLTSLGVPLPVASALGGIAGSFANRALSGESLTVRNFLVQDVLVGGGLGAAQGYFWSKVYPSLVKGATFDEALEHYIEGKLGISLTKFFVKDAARRSEMMMPADMELFESPLFQMQTAGAAK